MPKSRSKTAAEPQTEAAEPPTPSSPTKLATLTVLLKRPQGATLADLMQGTGWQAHSCRGALAGALKKAGLIITSSKADGVRTYRAEGAA